jgi:hypothetical protein
MRYWTPEEDAQLGTERDSVIAKRLGRPASGVADRRRALGIPRCGIHDPPANAWQPEEVKFLGTASDAEVARRTGRTANAVKAHRRLLGISNLFPKRAPKRS